MSGEPFFLHALDDDVMFPPAEQALTEPDGLLAFSRNITLARLESAYRQGIFPWYSDDQPVLWWSPESRMVLDCEKFHASHSLRKRLKKIARDQSLGDLRSCVVTVNCAFNAVLEGCATRGDASQNASTWITPHMQQAYKAWHQQGRVHSIEAWQNDELVGGLYGVSIGATFFGESMFTRATDASKIALAHLVKFLKRQNVSFIDCQMVTNHLGTLGASPINRANFLSRVAKGIDQPNLPWQAGWINSEGEIMPKSTLLALPFVS